MLCRDQTRKHPHTAGGNGAVPRVSIRMDKSSNPCANQGWYAYEGATSGLGLLFTNFLTTAYTNGKTIVVHGTGTCDVFGVEKIQSIDIE